MNGQHSRAGYKVAHTVGVKEYEMNRNLLVFLDDENTTSLNFYCPLGMIIMHYLIILQMTSFLLRRGKSYTQWNKIPSEVVFNSLYISSTYTVNIYRYKAIGANATSSVISTTWKCISPCLEILQLLQVILQGLKDYLQRLKDFQTGSNAFPGTVQSRALTRVTIQKIKSLGVLQFEFYVVKGGATNRDMSLTETCFCSRLYGIYHNKMDPQEFQRDGAYGLTLYLGSLRQSCRCSRRG